MLWSIKHTYIQYQWKQSSFVRPIKKREREREDTNDQFKEIGDITTDTKNTL